MQKGIIKWFCEHEGLGIIESLDNPFCFSLKDFTGELKEGLAVTFEATSKKISIHDQLMSVALNVTSDLK